MTMDERTIERPGGAASELERLELRAAGLARALEELSAENEELRAENKRLKEERK